MGRYAALLMFFVSLNANAENIFRKAHEECKHLMPDGYTEYGTPKYTPEFNACFDAIVAEDKAKKRAEFNERCPSDRRTVSPMFQGWFC